MKNPNVTILGATGAVGREMIKILGGAQFPYCELRCLASARSVGKKLPFAGREITVEEATDAPLLMQILCWAQPRMILLVVLPRQSRRLVQYLLIIPVPSVWMKMFR